MSDENGKLLHVRILSLFVELEDGTKHELAPKQLQWRYRDVDVPAKTVTAHFFAAEEQPKRKAKKKKGKTDSVGSVESEFAQEPD